ncbi:MAG: 50S ribosomal protein L1 [Desulfovibrio sp.]|uniref:50S ribosomal protein L1 n=1 Tax=Desulfovibrio sp. 7SRBS1 TaxID=3378064 RepID=UPI003B4175D9
MPKHGKKYRNAVEGREQGVRISVDEAVKQAVEKAFAKFDETVDVVFNLGVDPKYSDQMVRGACTLPNGLGKDVRVLALCKGDKQAEAKEAGADYVGEAELIEKIQGGWFDFDKVVATPDMMALVGKIGRVLGPRGLMPNAKTGTVTFDIGVAVQELKAGKVEFKVDKAGVLHAPLGKVSFGPEKIMENLQALFAQVMRLKPSGAKGTYVQGAAVSTTMGPGYKIDPQTLRKLEEV